MFLKARGSTMTEDDMKAMIAVSKEAREAAINAGPTAMEKYMVLQDSLINTLTEKMPKTPGNTLMSQLRNPAKGGRKTAKRRKNRRRSL